MDWARLNEKSLEMRKLVMESFEFLCGYVLHITRLMPGPLVPPQSHDSVVSQ